MSRTVFDNSQTAHVWEAGRIPAGRSANGNFSFAGPLLYSYATVIGHRLAADLPCLNAEREKPDAPVYLVTSTTYSTTTSGKHMPALWRAIDYGRGRVVFRVPFPNVPRQGGYDGGNHAANVAHLAEPTTGVVERARKIRIGSRDAKPNTYDDSLIRYGTETPAFLAESMRAADLAASYADTFTDAAFDRAPADAANAEAERIFAERLAAHDTPEALAKREKAAAKSAERREAREAAVAAREAEGMRKQEARFREGESFAGFVLNGGTAALRARGVKRDTAGDIIGGELQTSQGATVPLVDAIRIFKVLGTVRARGEAFEPRLARVGHFNVDRIEPNGDFRAGCHRIAYAECATLAASLGVTI